MLLGRWSVGLECHAISRRRVLDSRLRETFHRNLSAGKVNKSDTCVPRRRLEDTLNLLVLQSKIADRTWTSLDVDRIVDCELCSVLIASLSLFGSTLAVGPTRASECYHHQGCADPLPFALY